MTREVNTPAAGPQDAGLCRHCANGSHQHDRFTGKTGEPAGSDAGCPFIGCHCAVIVPVRAVAASHCPTCRCTPAAGDDGDMTPAEDLAVVRARLERMVALADAATPGPWTTHWQYADSGNVEAYTVASSSGRVAETSRLRRGWDDAAFIAAASPDRLLRVAREALIVLDRHSSTDSGGCRWCGCGWPCLGFDGALRAVLRAWQP